MKAIGQVTVEKRTEGFYFFVNFLEIVLFFFWSLYFTSGRPAKYLELPSKKEIGPPKVGSCNK